MKQIMVIGKFFPISKKFYPDKDKWKNRMIALEENFFVNKQDNLAYPLSPFWLKSMKNHGEKIPVFKNVLAQDFMILGSIEITPVLDEKPSCRRK